MSAKALSLFVGAWLFLLLRASAATLPILATGANVDESRVSKILYVDPAHTEAADDSKHGGADAPFATLAFACEAAARAKDAGLGVKLILAAGTYRETAMIRSPPVGTPDTDAPLVIEAAEREQAVIDGADTEGWSPSTWKVEDGHWTHPWPYRRAAAGRPAPNLAGAPGESYRRGDLVIVNGAPLRQVNTAADLAPGSFLATLPIAARGKRGASGSGSGESMVVVQPPEETELPGSVIQVGMRARGLMIVRRRNVVVRGLLIQHAADPSGTGEKTAGLVMEDCANILVEDVLSQWNDGAGISIAGQRAMSADLTLRRVRLLHNGGSGLEVTGVQNLLVEDNETSFNNFRGEWAGWIDPQGPAAVKVEAVRGSTWRRQHVVGNACRGFWWVGDDADVTVEDAVVRDNVGSGMCVGNGAGPVLVRRCLVARTKGWPSPNGLAFTAGVLLAGTSDVTLESNVSANNASVQLGLVAEGNGKAERHVYRHNVFFGVAPDECLYRMPVPGAGNYYATLESGQNCFWNPTKAEAFEEYSYRAPSRKTPAAYTSRGMKLDEWQAEVLTQGAKSAGEAGSRWEDPLFSDAPEGDYRLKRGSPVEDWDLPSDETAAAQ